MFINGDHDAVRRPCGCNRDPVAFGHYHEPGGPVCNMALQAFNVFVLCPVEMYAIYGGKRNDQANSRRGNTRAAHG
jgi:hypothetical protein